MCVTWTFTVLFDVPAARDAELDPQRVGVRLGRSRGDSQPVRDLHVRAPSTDEVHDPPLAKREA